MSLHEKQIAEGLAAVRLMAEVLAQADTSALTLAIAIESMVAVYAVHFGREAAAERCYRAADTLATTGTAES